MLRPNFIPEDDMKKGANITKKNLLEKASLLGLKNVQRLRKVELIHRIQSAEGNRPCFQQIPDCMVSPCMFRGECIPQV